MSTCVRCGRKGRRTCPGLTGTICAACCGTYRLREIDCPPQCIYLGSLSVVRGPQAGGGFTDADYDAMFEKLAAYAYGRTDLGGPAVRRFFEDALEDLRPAEWEVPIGLAYLYHGHRDTSGRRVIDHFLAARGQSLSRAEVAAGLALQRAWASLFEVTSVQRGVRLGLRDVLSGETHVVREVAATAQLRPRHVLFAWLIAFPGHLELAAACVVPPNHLEAVRAAFEAALAGARGDHPDLDDRELTGDLAPVVAQAIRSATSVLPAPAQHLRAHYRRWLDTPLPALGGESPRAAARTPAGRARLEALLDESERDARQMDGGGAASDLPERRRDIGLGGGDAIESPGYDAAAAPDAAGWLALDDARKTHAIELYHRELIARGAHPELPGPAAHAMMHVIVENQLAVGYPPEVRSALERLMADGLSRHEAIHAVGSVVAAAMWRIMRGEPPVERAWLVRELDALRAADWRF